MTEEKIHFESKAGTIDRITEAYNMKVAVIKELGVAFNAGDHEKAAKLHDRLMAIKFQECLDD